jgi:Tol biopolymer transport system component
MVGRARRSVLFTLLLAAAMAALVALAGTMQEAKAAAINEKIVFVSDRTTGTGVNNPTGDFEIFKMNPDGTGIKQLTTNQVKDDRPTLSPDGKKIVYVSEGIQTSNPEGDREVYGMSALDGSGQTNLSYNGVNDYGANFSPDGTKVAYLSTGVQPTNPEGDFDVYVANASDGTDEKNLSNNGAGEDDSSPDGGRQAM